MQKYSASVPLILREQPDKEFSTFLLAGMLNKLAKLYQIPSFDGENAAILADWIMDNYKYETLGSVVEVLKTPPLLGRSNWRLTPDTIEAWMKVQLEKEAEKREREHNQIKQEELKLSLPSIPNFSELFKGTWYEEVEHEQKFKQNKYDQIKQEFLDRKKQQNEENNTTVHQGQGD